MVALNSGRPWSLCVLALIMVPLTLLGAQPAKPVGGRQLQDLQVYLGSLQLLVGPSTYEEGPPLRPFALIGSSSLLEVSVRNGSAHEITGCSVGTSVLVRRQE